MSLSCLGYKFQQAWNNEIGGEYYSDNNRQRRQQSAENILCEATLATQEGNQQHHWHHCKILKYQDTQYQTSMWCIQFASLLQASQHYGST